MVKVCHMTSAHKAFDERIFNKECKTLSNYGFEVFLVVRGESTKAEGVNVIGVDFTPSNRLERIFGASKAVYKQALNINADVYHFHDPELLPYGLKLARKGKTVVFDSHENTADSILEKKWIPALLRKIVKLFYEHYQAYVVKRLSGVVTVTDTLLSYFKQYNDNVIRVANFPKVEDFATKRTPTKKYSLIFAGGISEQWNIDKVLKAVENMDNVNICLCGGGDNDYLMQLKRMPAWNKVNYLGRVSHERVVECLYDSSVGLALATPGNNTHWQKGSIGNTKLFEEMLAGLPVICTDFELWKTIVEDNNAGICVRWNDVSAIEQAIRTLLSDEVLAKQKGINGQKVILSDYNWDVESKKLITFYEKITRV